MGKATPQFRGEFVIEAPLARGGFGSVFLARQLSLGRRVVIKVLEAAALEDTELVHRFEREARVTALIRHPAIVEVIAHGVEDGAPWIAYEYVDGGSVRDRLKSGPLPLDEALEATMQVATGLAAAHDAGVIHRDVKPDNILIAGPHHYKLADFGIARPTADRSLATAPGMTLGTPFYMAPEQIRSHPVPASDLYSLGVVLFELVTGGLPFPDADPGAALRWHLGGDRDAIGRDEPALAPALRTLVKRALATDPADRFASAHEMEVALRHLLDAGAPGIAGGRASAAPRSRGFQPDTVVQERSAAVAVPEPADRPRSSARTAGFASITLGLLVVISITLLHPPSGTAPSTNPSSSTPASVASPPPAATPVYGKIGGFDDAWMALHGALQDWRSRKDARESWKNGTVPEKLPGIEELRADERCVGVAHAIVKDLRGRSGDEIPLEDDQLLLYLRALAYGYNWSRSIMQYRMRLAPLEGRHTPLQQVKSRAHEVPPALYLRAFGEALERAVGRVREGTPDLRSGHRDLLQTVWDLHRGSDYYPEEKARAASALRDLENRLRALTRDPTDEVDAAFCRQLLWKWTSAGDKLLSREGRQERQDRAFLKQHFRP